MKKPKTVIAIIADILAQDEEKVVPAARLVEDFGADSLDLIELMMEIEVEFDIDVTDAEAAAILTVQDATDLVDRKVAAQAPAAA